MSGTNAYLATAHLDSGKAVPLPPVMLPYSPEFSTSQNAAKRIVELAKSTGGREFLRPEEIWDRIPRQWRLLDATPILAVIATVLLLMEVAERRLGLFARAWDGHVVKKTHKEEKPAIAPPRKRASRPMQPVVQAPPEEPQPLKAPEKPTPLEDALRKAKHK